jgi:peptidoglycan-associated lipoprotein
MKIKLVTSAALALAVVLAATGCKHKPTPITPIPPGQGAPVGDINGGGTINPNNGGMNMGGVGSGPAPIAENGESWDIANYTQDRDTLATDTIHFAFDSAVIRDSEKASLQSVAAALQADPSTKLLIEGDCDERGTEEYNRSLGERRALAAREALAGMGVDPMRIRTISYGKDKPADPGHDEAAWSKNRRDDFVLLKPKMGT